MLRAARVGKTLSARQYAGWDIVDPYLLVFRPLDVMPMPQRAMANRTIIYTPRVHTTPRILDKEITFQHDRLSWGIEWELQTPKDFASLSKSCGQCAELLIVDEADRLKTLALKQLRDHRDRTGTGLILIGMPASKSAWPATRSSTAGSSSSTITGEAVVAITRITSGNFRLTGRLIAQIQRILDISHLSVVTSQVVEAAREGARHRGHVESSAAGRAVPRC